MAFLVAKGLATNPLMIRPVAMLRSTAGSSSRLYSSLNLSLANATVSSRFYSTKTNIDQESNLKLEGRCLMQDNFDGVEDIYKRAFRPQLSATRNLARLLNKLDAEFHVYPACGSLRWDVMEDAKALYLVRDMSDTTKTVEVEEYTHLDIYSGPSHVFGCVRVYDWMDMIRILVGKDGPNPGVTYGGFLIGIKLPEDLFKHDSEFRRMNVKNDVLKITIPKQKDKWIHTITTKVNFIPKV